MSDYRFDNRSKARFKKDLKNNHVKEAYIAVRLCIAEHSKTKEWPKLTPNGIDFTGEFIENIKEVTASPDFIIGDKTVEITRSDVVCNRSFHAKCNKIIKCLKEGHDLVFVNGYDAEKQPNYIRLTPKEIEKFTIKATSKYGEMRHPGGGKMGLTCKPAYRYDVFWFEDLWKPLPAIIKDLPKEYLEILESVK